MEVFQIMVKEITKYNVVAKTINKLYNPVKRRQAVGLASGQ